MIGRRLFLQHSSSLMGLVGLSLIACRSEGDRPIADATQEGIVTMRLESAAFAANDLIPVEYTCDGADSSPPLTWDDPPDATQSLALICDDPDAPVGTFVHWVLYNLPPETRSLSAGVSDQPTLPNGGVQGKNDFNQFGYGGPCPPGGTHRYFFKLYALDTKLDLQPGARKAQVEKAIAGHVLTQAELVGRYTRQR